MGHSLRKVSMHKSEEENKKNKEFGETEKSICATEQQKEF